MRRYWVMLDTNWEVTAVEDYGRPSSPASTYPSAYEPGELGDWLFDTDEIHSADPKRLVGKPFDLVFDAQDELAAFAQAMIVVQTMKDMCDEPLLGSV